MAFSHPGCPIRMSADQCLFAAPRSFSQLTTSFLAVRSLGILRSLFFASFFFSYSLLSTLISNFFLSEPFQTFVLHVSLKLQSLIFLLQTLSYFLYLYISLKISMNFPPLPKGTAKVAIFSFLPNFCRKSFKKIFAKSAAGAAKALTICCRTQTGANPTQSGIPLCRRCRRG